MTTQSNGSSLMVQGRIVWTSGKTLFEGAHKKDQNTNQLVYDQNGQPVISYGFGLAIPKTDPRTGQPTEMFKLVWETMHKEAFTLYPSGQIPPGFAMKYKDGDGVDHKGVSFAQREGHAGHIILACTTYIPIKFFRFEGGNNILVNDGIKCGDYVNVQLNIKAHPAKGQGKAGLYLNPSAVQLIQPGKEIINTPSGDQLFGQAAPVYQGVVDAYQAPTMPNVAAQPAPMMPPMGAPAPMTAAPAMPAYAPQGAPAPAPAHYGVLPQTHQPAGMPMGHAQPHNTGYVAPTGAPAMPAFPGMPR
jgi:hypothetical protein